MNTRDFPTLHFGTNYNAFHCCSTFHSNSKVLNNENNSYLKMGVKHPYTTDKSIMYSIRNDEQFPIENIYI